MFDLILFYISGLFSSRIDRKKDKAERKILDSQERAFWDVHRPVVSSGQSHDKRGEKREMRV